MDNEESIAASILAKFQQINSEKEQARSENNTKPIGKPTDDKIKETNKKRKNEKSDCTYLVNGLKESAVGIEEYVNDTCSGFLGIIKHRFSDFQVHEIDLEGNVVELKSTKLPEITEETKTEEEFDHKSALSENDWKKLDEIVASDSDTSFIEIDVTDKDKSERTLMHKAIKSIYGPKFYSNTITKDGKTVLKVGKCKKNQDRISWPANQGQFLHFTVFKENIDSTNVVSKIAHKLRVKANNISYCGIKDKRGKTTQRMCIRRRRAEDLHNLKFRQITLGDYCYKHKSLRLKDLSGNKFTLAVRGVEESEDKINESLNSLKENGFINYYGLQRFGSSPFSPTYSVGREILRKNWKEVIEMILGARNGEQCLQHLVDALETWASTKDASQAIKFLPKNDTSIEGKIIRALKAQGNDQYYNALFALPRNTMLLYVHAYQSLIWNKVVSKRLKQFGFKPIVGDLIFDSNPENEVDDDIKQSDDDVDDGEDEGGGDEEQEKEEKDNEAKIAQSCVKQRVKKLTSEDLVNVNFDEVVLPLPGNDIDYPDNDTKNWYIEFLAEDGLTLEDFNNVNSKVFALYGSYRHIIGRAEDLSWNIVKYNIFSDDLILSDLDKLNNQTLPEQPPNAQFKAVILDFKLKSSQYATMVLREVMKCETAVSYHAALTKISHSSLEEPKEKKMKP